jgi:phosphoglycolate phosphatase-like HAD superfamily hydrolase
VKKLILFDIDGTLVLTGGAGARAMAYAFADVFGLHDTLGTINFAGRTDAWIVAQIAAEHAHASDPETLRRFHDVYVGYLSREIERPGPRKGVLPGVRPLLEILARRNDTYLALLTGNFERGAQIKLEYFDLWGYFRCGAFGDAAHDRNGLLHAAFTRVVSCGGPAVTPEHAVIVGDTPLDVAVARSGGARSLAVATGSYGADALKASGADVVLPDLTDVDAVLEALGLCDRPGGAGPVWD